MFSLPLALSHSGIRSTVRVHTDSTRCRPETMGAVCAVVYLLVLIFFIPFAFYKDIVAATSGGGNRDIVLEVHHVETGRTLHRFPHDRVSILGILPVWPRSSTGMIC